MKRYCLDRIVSIITIYKMAGPDDRLRLDDFVPYRLSYTSNLVSDAIARTYESLFGLTIPEWRLVAVIAEHDGIAQAAICTRTGMDKVTVSRAAIALTTRGLVGRAPNLTDRRSHDLELTAAGRALYAQVTPRRWNWKSKFLASWQSGNWQRSWPHCGGWTP